MSELSRTAALAAGRTRSRWPRRLAGLAGCGFLLMLAPVVLLAGAGNPPGCTLPGPAGVSTPVGPASGALFAQPLQMLPGHWYQVGATEYGGPSDPSSGVFGSSGAYLPAFPDSFAELSLLDTNPANAGGQLTFQDADALDNVPYGTQIRVRNGSAEAVLAKRDTGYGQGPGQTIPYRIDVWYAAAAPLGISKNPVDIELAPHSGTGPILGQLPAATAGSDAAAPPSTGCATGASGAAGTLGPLPLTPGQTATINPATGVASAPEDAPRQVKLLIAAGNALIDKPYIWGGGHGSFYDTGYDCSGGVSYMLHEAGIFAPAPEDSTELETYGDPGPGSWVSVYANSVHAFIYVAGIVMDTVPFTGLDPRINPAGGSQWGPAAVISAQQASDEAAGNGGFVVRHPNGL